jgi:predicted RNA polymerase sigma factor
MAFGPAEGLTVVELLAAGPSLAAYHLLPAVRGDLLAKLDRRDEGGGADEERTRAELSSPTRRRGDGAPTALVAISAHGP